jgi:hypothetical protein
MYNLLPPDEQVFHEYLLDQKPITVTLQKMAQKYQNDLITLADFRDYKFPDRKEVREKDAFDYPLPYKMDDCVVCLMQDIASIHCPCLNCKNMVCQQCIKTNFLNEKTKLGSFIYMHR